MRLHAALLGTAVLVAAGLACDSTGPGQVERTIQRAQLEAARARWTEVGPKDYTYAVERLCFCGYVGPARVTVIDGAVASVVFVEEDAPPVEPMAELYPAVDGLFDILEDAMDRGAHEITVTYDPGTGVPLEFFIDYEAQVADEELGMRVTERVTPTDPDPGA